MTSSHRSLRALSLVSRLISVILSRWFLVAVVVFFVSPVGPHIRWEYSYEGRGGTRFYTRCTYLGSRGFTVPNFFGECPFFAILDGRRGV